MITPSPLKLCVSCTHYRDGGCGHPSLIGDPVHGGSKVRSAERMRENDGPCGPEGRLFYSSGDPSSAGAPEVRYGDHPV
jgi:hypothetical protein